jgi:hypothetical protein
MPDATEHSLVSSYREVVLEHLLVGALMRELWLSGVRRIEVLKPQVDDSGYDLVLEAKGIDRLTHAGIARRRWEVVGTPTIKRWPNR